MVDSRLFIEKGIEIITNIFFTMRLEPDQT